MNPDSLSNNSPDVGTNGIADPGTLIIDKYPGKLYRSGEVAGHYFGCKAKLFIKYGGGPEVDDQLNKWAEENDLKYIVVEMQYSYDALLILYTQRLDEEDQQVLRDHGDEIARVVQEKRDERRKAKEEAEAALLKTMQEERELAELGRRCKENHPKGGAK